MGRSLIQVEYKKPQPDKPGVKYSKKWVVSGGKGRQKTKWAHFDKKKAAVTYARNNAKDRHTKPSTLKIYGKSGSLTKTHRYD